MTAIVTRYPETNRFGAEETDCRKGPCCSAGQQNNPINKAVKRPDDFRSRLRTQKCHHLLNLPILVSYLNHATVAGHLGSPLCELVYAENPGHAQVLRMLSVVIDNRAAKICVFPRKLTKDC